jgi:tubulin-like protein
MNDATGVTRDTVGREEFRPTLLVGIGGTGIKIADRIYRMTLDQHAWFGDRLTVMGLDTDENDMRQVRSMDRRRVLKLSSNERVYQLLDKHPSVEPAWFGPRSRLPHEILNMTLLDGAAQIRLLTRLALQHQLWIGGSQQSRLSLELGAEIGRIAAVNSRTKFEGAINIMMVGSLAGATGSGSFIALALLLGDLCRDRRITAEVHGMFLMPDVYVRGGSMLTSQIDNVMANAYAALKELNAVNLLAGRRGDYMEFDYEYAPGRRIAEGGFPFRTISLIDYENTKGSNLGRNLDNYFAMATRAAYITLFTPIGQKVKSVSVNDARAITMAASQGTNNMFASVGVSAIEYPADEIADYLVIRLALQNLEGDWLRLDRSYFERIRRYEEQRAAGNLAARKPDQGQVFLEDLQQFATKDRLQFFAEIHERLNPVLVDAQGNERAEPLHIQYLDAVVAEVTSRFWARTRLAEAKGRAQIDASQLKPVSTLTESVRKLEHMLDSDLREIDASLVSVPEDDFINILLTADDMSEAEWRPFHLESYLIKGGPHLVQVRAFLYALAKEIASRKAGIDHKQRRLQLFRRANDIDPDHGLNPTTRRSPRTLEIARDVANRGMINRMRKGSPDDFMQSYTDYYNASLRMLQNYAQDVISAKVLDLLLDEIHGLDRHLSGLFLELRTIFTRLEQDAQVAERRHGSEYNVSDGYVWINADDTAKSEAWQEMSRRAVGLRLADDANRTLSLGVYRQFRENRRQRTTTDFAELGKIFLKATRDDFARTAVETDFRSLYDFGVIEAVKRESIRLKQDWKARLRTLIDLVSSQSEPFVTLTDTNHGQRSMYWAIHPSVQEDINDATEFDNLFTFTQGEQPLIEEVFSKRQLLCFNSRVLLELTHFAKLNPGDARRQNINATAQGGYFRAYSRMVDSLIEEDLDPAGGKSPHITPHIDAAWHRPGVLPEISPDIGRAQRAETYRGFAIATALGLIEFNQDYGKSIAEFNTLGKVRKGGVVGALANTHDLWTVVKSFSRQSQYARATIRYWSELKQRAREGEQLRIDPLARLAAPSLAATFLGMAVARDESAEREAACRQILAGWIDVLSDWMAVARVDLAESGRRQQVERLVQEARETALATLRENGVRSETLIALDRLFSSAVETNQEPAEAQ